MLRRHKATEGGGEPSPDIADWLAHDDTLSGGYVFTRPGPWSPRSPSSGQNEEVYQSDPNLSVFTDDTPPWRYLDFARKPEW